MHETDFLVRSEPINQQNKHKASHFLGLIFLVLGVIMVLGFVWTAINVGFMATSLLDGRDRLMEAKGAVENLNFDQAKKSLSLAEGDFSDAGKYLKRVGWLKVLPWLGPQVNATQVLFDSSANLFAIVNQVADLGSDVLRLVGTTSDSTGQLTNLPPLKYDEMSPETKRLVLQRINGASPDLVLAAEQARLVKEEIDNLNDVPGPAGLVVKKLDSLLSESYDALQLAATASRIIPAFTGLEKEKVFLLLLENNSEMRPAGGFIGTYGILRIQDGEIKELEFNDSYLIDSAANPDVLVEPPAPLKNYLSATKWYFRDSNWSPDFTVSARNAISMFTNEVLSIPPEIRTNIQEPLSFDGVIAFTPNLAADFLKIIGPITIDGQTFSSENILDTLEYQAEKGFQENGIPYEQRKDIITALFNEMKTKVFDLPLADWGPLAQAVSNNLNHKQIVLFSNSSSESEEVIAKAGWGGLVSVGENDFLMVADANLASLKTDPKVDRTISYSIKKSDDGRFVGKTIVHYQHNGIFDWKTTRYRTYTRIYVPLGSELVSSSAAADVGQELGATVFGSFISIEPSESGDLVFEYYLPAKIQAEIEAENYSLLVNKQIGSANHSLTLNLDFGKKVIGATPSENQLEWGDKVYRVETILDTDKDFGVWF